MGDGNRAKPNAGGVVQPRVKKVNPRRADAAGAERPRARLRKGPRAPSPALSGDAAESHGHHHPGPEGGDDELVAAEPDAARHGGGPSQAELLRCWAQQQAALAAAPVPAAPVAFADPANEPARKASPPPVRPGPLPKPNHTLGFPSTESAALRTAAAARATLPKWPAPSPRKTFSRARGRRKF